MSRYAIKILRSRRGKAFPQKSIKFKTISMWECFAQNLKPQGYAIGYSKEGFAFTNGDRSGEFRNSRANAKPLLLPKKQMIK